MSGTSVIVPLWNGRDHVGACLTALQAQQPTPLEIIVVDNGSTDGSAGQVARDFPAARLIRNEANLGFGGACNAGLAVARGELLVLLNQDTIVAPGWLAALEAAFETEARPGIVGCKSFYPDGTVQHAGGFVDRRGVGHHHGYREADDGRFDEPREVPFVTGAALTIARPVLDAIGPLDEGFAPAYYEDVDWCFRARRAGFPVLYRPEARLVHAEESSGAQPTRGGSHLLQRNRLRFVLKHWPLDTLADDFLPAERSWLQTLAATDDPLLPEMERLYRDHRAGLAELLPWRARLLGEAEADGKRLAELLGRLSESAARAELGLAGTRPEALADVAERGYQVRSGLPAIGPRLATLRRHLTSHFREPYFDPTIERQVVVNRQLAEMTRVLGQLLRVRTDFLRPPAPHPSAPAVAHAWEEAQTLPLDSAALVAGPLPDYGPLLGRRFYGALFEAAQRASSEAAREALMTLQERARLAEEEAELRATQRTFLGYYGEQVRADIVDRHYALHSEQPYIGALIVGLRRWITRELWQGYVAPVLERQVAFNRAAITACAAALEGEREGLDVLRRAAHIREVAPTRGLPVVGPLLRRIRRELTSHLRGPYIEPIFERQERFNQTLVGELERLAARARKLRQRGASPDAPTVAAVRQRLATLRGNGVDELIAQMERGLEGAP